MIKGNIIKNKVRAKSKGTKPIKIQYMYLNEFTKQSYNDREGELIEQPIQGLTSNDGHRQSEES